MSTDTGPEPRRGAWLPERWTRILIALVSLAVVAGWGVLAASHVDDRYQVDHIAGTRLGLAMWADRGTLYPPLFDGEHYGGVPYMPVPVVLHTAVAKITGEYLVSGKLVSHASMLALLAVSYLALRRLGCPPPVAFGFTAAILASRIGFEQATGVHGDALPVALQIGALLLVARSERPSATIGGGVLSALAVVSKTSAVWAPVAVCIVLLVRDRRRLAWFAGSFAVVLAGLLVALQLATDGRFGRNLFSLGGTWVGQDASLLRPLRVVPLLVTGAIAVWALVPAAALEVVAAIRERAATFFHVALLSAVPVTFVIFTAQGTNANHLIDLVVLVAIVAGALWARAGSAGAVRPLLSVALILGVGASLLEGVATAPGATVTAAAPVVAAAGGEANVAARPLDEHLDPEDDILSADPGIPVAYGRLPVVLNPFLLPRMGVAHPEYIDHLVSRIEAQEFDHLVLLFELGTPFGDRWYAEFAFGSEVAAAMERSYRLQAREGRYLVYAPA